MYQVNEIMGDRYRIFKRVIGGMGIVYFVKDLDSDKKYAAKTYRPDLIENRDKFIQELIFLSELGEHENCLSVRFIDIIDDQPFLFSDYIPNSDKGNSLRARIHLYEYNFSQAIQFAYQIACGMEFLNSRLEVAHLDLKPENILITEQDIIKICDFGLARFINPLQINPAGEAWGTQLYKSPEHLDHKIVDTRSDVFSYGIILYEMLLGHYPFKIDLDGSRDTITKALKKLYAENNIGHDIYYKGIPEFSKERIHDYPIVSGIKKSKLIELGILLAACINTYSGDRYYRFKDIVEAFEFGFRGYLGRKKSKYEKSRDEFQIGMDLQKIGEHSKALQHFNTVLKSTRNNAEVWYRAAISMAELGLHDTSVDFILEALRLDPANELYRTILNRYKDRE